MGVISKIIFDSNDAGKLSYTKKYAIEILVQIKLPFSSFGDTKYGIPEMKKKPLEMDLKMLYL